MDTDIASNSSVFTVGLGNESSEPLYESPTSLINIEALQLPPTSDGVCALVGVIVSDVVFF